MNCTAICVVYVSPDVCSVFTVCCLSQGSHLICLFSLHARIMHNQITLLSFHLLALLHTADTTFYALSFFGFIFLSKTINNPLALLFLLFPHCAHYLLTPAYFPLTYTFLPIPQHSWIEIMKFHTRAYTSLTLDFSRSAC